MTFDNRKRDFTRERIDIIQLQLDYCSLNFGTGDCVGGERTITTSAVSVDDFNVGDEIEGGTSGAVATIISISGSSPTYTITYRATNGIDFQTASETITNNTATGSATKNGSAPVLLTSGDGKCYNTLETCQSLVNYEQNKTTKTYRFCTNRSPHPIGLEAEPFIPSSGNAITITPSLIDPKGGLGARASISVTLNDSPSSDIDIDPYVSERSYNAFERGTYATRLRARNPNYENRPMQYLSGYLVDGVFDESNFETSHFLIDTINVSSGSWSIKGKDTLKLAMRNKAQVPAPSEGKLTLTLTAGATSFTLSETGAGDAGYPSTASGVFYVLIDKEIIQVNTRAGDSFSSVTRAQFNTTAVEHAAGATVQLCFYKNDYVDEIVSDILINYCGVDASFINTSAWATERASKITGLLNGIVPKPTDASKILQELAEAKPHKLYWDEKAEKIIFKALAAPSASFTAYDMDQHIVAGSVSCMDRVDMRYSTVFVSYGIFDPTEKLDEPSNYQQTYARIDLDSVNKYGSNQVKTIRSRWFGINSGAFARQLAALIGRRYANIPREIDFSFDAKDSDVWLGQSIAINHRDMVDFTGAPKDIPVEIISARNDSGIYRYKGIEFLYGEALDQDEAAGEDDILEVDITIDQQNINLYDIFITEYGAVDALKTAQFNFSNNVVIGSSSTGTNSVETGTTVQWSGMAVRVVVSSGSYIVGAGGNGSNTGADGGDGGDAINAQVDFELINDGVIGGGGGGGGATTVGFVTTGGGGGAGNDVGLGAANAYSGPGTVDSNTPGQNGTLENGGQGGSMDITTAGEPVTYNGVDGGDLGQDGQNSTTNGGAAGNAINLNGNTVTDGDGNDITTTGDGGDIRGTVA